MLYHCILVAILVQELQNFPLIFSLVFLMNNCDNRWKGNGTFIDKMFQFRKGIVDVMCPSTYSMTIQFKNRAWIVQYFLKTTERNKSPSPESNSKSCSRFLSWMSTSAIAGRWRSRSQRASDLNANAVSGQQAWQVWQSRAGVYCQRKLSLLNRLAPVLTVYILKKSSYRGLLPSF